MEIIIYPDEVIKDKNCGFGILYEDISHASDGGLHGEMLQNRSFEYCDDDNPSFTPLTAWEKIERGDSLTRLHVDSFNPYNTKNPHYLTLNVSRSGAGDGFQNTGYNSGLYIKKDEEYIFTCRYRLNTVLTRKTSDGSYPALHVRLESEDNSRIFAAGSFVPVDDMWHTTELTLKPNETHIGARLSVFCTDGITIDFDMLSLFPVNTFKRRKNGLRQDIAQKIADIKPAFVRFPGGCVVHCGSLDGDRHDSLYRWKNTIGDISERPARKSRWNYSQSNGFGFYEMFCFCEDIGAIPLPVISAGYDPHTLLAAPLDMMGKWIDDALDLIEFANGSADTKWGAKRAAMGHPEPFNMRYLCIGNEEVGEGFFERYRLIAKAVREKYPEIKLIGSSGPSSDGALNDYAQKVAMETGTDMIDEHFYQSCEWLLANYNKYENSTSPADLLISEYSSRGNSLFNALSEAVIMTDFEKAPRVKFASYAPLLCNCDYENWRPNMIWFNNHSVYGTTSYYVQKLFVNYCGDKVVKAVDDIPPADITRPSLRGMTAISTALGHADISDISITDNLSGKRLTKDNFSVSPDNKYVELFNFDSDSYTLEFTIVKTHTDISSDMAGKSDIMLEFARQDNKNLLNCGLNGWQGLSSLNGITHGETCGLSTCEFSIKEKNSYRVVLTVNKNTADVSINGINYHHIELSLPAEPAPVYYSAVTGSDGLIVKLINIKDQPCTLNINLASCPKYTQVKLHTLCGDRNAENSFDAPEKIVPVSTADTVSSDSYPYTAKPYSLSVLCFS